MPSREPFPVEFAVTPRFDVFYALYALTNSAPSPLDGWKERVLLRLPRDFERVARRVAPIPLFWPLLADALQGTPGEMSFDEILSELRALPADKLQTNVLSGIFHDRGTVRSLLTRKKSLRQVLADEQLPGGELLAHFGLRPYTAKAHAASAVATLLSEPESFRGELALVLERFWQAGFRRDWAALEPSLRADAFRMKELHENGSLAEVARELKLPLTPDDGAKELRPKKGPAIRYDRVDRCYIMPSVFNTGRWWARYETKGGRVSLYFPVHSGAASPSRIVEEDRPRERAPRRESGPAIDPAAVFRALGDTTRYAIASILARTPTTSAELARRLKVSKPTISHHVHSLRSAGLIDETADGGSLKLSLNADTIRRLSAASVEELFSSTGELQLLTTRKRRN